MSAKKLYALYEGDLLLGEYTAKEISEKTGLDNHNVSAYTACGEKRVGNYRVVRTDDSVLTKSDRPLLMEFEKEARRILKLCGGRKNEN